MKDQRTKVTDAQLIEALAECGGIFAKAARYIEDKYKITYTRQAVYKRANNFPEELLQIREANIDKAEAVLDELLDTGDDSTRFRVAKFILETKGKDRGYIIKKEIDNKQNISVESFLGQFRNRE